MRKVLTNKIIYTFGAAYALAKRSVLIQMKEHLLGYAWVFIIPMLYAFCYVFIKKELSGVGSHDAATASFDALRAFSGITLLQFWIQLVQSLSDLIRKQRGMLRGLTVTASPFAFAVILEAGVALVIRVVLILIAIPILGLSFPSDAVSLGLFFCAIMSLLMTAAAIGLILLPWAALYSDVRKLLSAMTLPILLVSPVFYPAVEDSNSWLYWLNSFNPVASPFAVLSDILQSGDGSPYVYQMFIGMFISVLFISWSLLRLGNQVPVLLERVGN